MSVEERVRGLVGEAIADLVREGFLPRETEDADFTVERPKRAEHGDLATNAALAIQKLAKKPPREIATKLAEKLAAEKSLVAGVEIAGPGFLNLKLTPHLFHETLLEVLEAGDAYGRARAATGERILLEFVSANPTGPLLISHGRGAIVGDAIGTLLEAAGHRVVREYYVNDFGNQVKLLCESVYVAAKGGVEPEGGYSKNDYVRELAAWIERTTPKAFDDRDALQRICVTFMINGVPGSSALPGIKTTLARLGVFHDSWISEEGLHRWGKVEPALQQLDTNGFLAKLDDGAIAFESTKLGDDKDRVVKKRDGDYTYFASDIAYHSDKLGRGFDRLIDVLGADHHGYVPRIVAMMKALGLAHDRFETVIIQLVSLVRDGEVVKMGKRLGNLITVEEVVDEIDEAAKRKGAGVDALRYFYLSKRSETHVELDIELAKKASIENPVFYLQYGYARLCSIHRRAIDVCGFESPRLEHAAKLASKLTHPDELAVLQYLGKFPQLVFDSAAAREPYRILFYIQELSQMFQSYFTRMKGDPILPPKQALANADWRASWDVEKTDARLAWIEAIRTVYGAGLRLAGITALERMDRLEATQDDDSGEGNST